MNRLSPQTKKILLFGIPALIFILIVGLSRRPSTPAETTEHAFITLPTQPTFEKGDPDFVSPYHHEDLYIAVMRPVWDKQLIASGLTLTTTTSPDVQFTSRIDAEDVVTIHMSRQRFSTDMSKAKVMAILHDDMQDPFLTNPNDYKVFCESRFTSNEDGSWTAQFMLGYDAVSSKIVDILFVYDNNIEYYTMMYVTKKHQYSKMYYQWLTPDEPVAEIHFNCGDEVITYGYYPEKTHTLLEWIKSSTNPHQWCEVQGMIVNPSAQWYIPAEQAQQIIYDGIIFDTVPILNNLLPGTATQFDTTNPQYLTSLLHQPRSVVEEALGPPKQTVQLSHIIKMEYDQCIVYLHPQNGVIQIDVRPGTQNIVNALPTQVCSGEELTKALRLSIIPYGNYRNITDTQAQYYRYYLPIQTSSCTISYVWESELQINPEYDKFTRIVIHSGEEYIY